MLPPLAKAIASVPVIGETYLLTAAGQAFGNAKSLGQRFSVWCKEAGLIGLSAHGVRKAVGHLLAEAECTQYQIMTIHGHTQAKTSEVYTKGVERWGLAKDATRTIRGLKW